MFESEYYPLWLIVLGLLLAYLHFSIEKRRRVEDAKWLAREREMRDKLLAHWGQVPGAAFDASLIAPQIRRLRQDHRAALHLRPHGAYYRKGLLATVRGMIASLPFFHRPTPEHEAHQHGA